MRAELLARAAGATGPELRSAVIFIDMMENDTAESAAAAAATLGADAASYFHDPEHRAGLAIAASLGWQHHVAWDTHLFYAPGVRWAGERPPTAIEWYHQLQDREVWEEQADTVQGDREWLQQLAERSEAHPALFRTDEELAVALREARERHTRPA